MPQKLIPNHRTINSKQLLRNCFLIPILYKSDLVSPFIKSKSPVLFHQLYCFRLILVFVLLIAFLLVDVCLNGRTCFFESRKRKFLIDFLRQVERVLFIILETHLYQVALRNEMLVSLIFVIELVVHREDILLQLFRTDVLKLERFDGIGEETPGRLEYFTNSFTRPV